MVPARVMFNVAYIPPPPGEEYFLMTIFGFLVVGVYSLGRVSRRRRPTGTLEFT